MAQHVGTAFIGSYYSQWVAHLFFIRVQSECVLGVGSYLVLKNVIFRHSLKPCNFGAEC